MMIHSPSGLEQTVADVFPCATLLPNRDRVAFVDELNATAEIHADPKLARRLRRSIDADGDAVTVPESPMAKPKERVAPRASNDGRDFRFATNDAVTGWEQICSTAAANARVAWERITSDPSTVVLAVLVNNSTSEG